MVIINEVGNKDFALIELSSFILGICPSVMKNLVLNEMRLDLVTASSIVSMA